METAAIAALAVIGAALAIVNPIANRLRIPSVLLYLVIGVVAGESVLGIVRPHDLEPIFEPVLEVLVGLIVFEGAFAINVDYLQRVSRVVRNLLTLGLMLTFGLGTLIVGGLGLLDWPTAFLYGALVTVTGPTVIGPLVKRVRLNERVRAVLIAEGVLIDPLGAILAVVVLESVLGGLEADSLVFVPTRLAAGFAIGLAAAALVRGFLRLMPGLSVSEVQLLLLGSTVSTFAVSGQLLDHTELMAMATMGLALAWMKIPHGEEVRSYEDDLSLLLIGAIYILSAATVELEVLSDLWPWGVLTVVLLMLVVRPLVVVACSLGSGLRWNERLYVGAIGPRGVVAASLAAFAGSQLGPEEGGPQLAALVFLTVFMTVAIQSTYADVVARLLGVKAMRVLIAGAGALARRVAHQLEGDGFDVLLIDADAATVERARAEGLQAEPGDVTDVRLLHRMGATEATIAVAATRVDQANLLFTQYLRSVNPDARLFVRVSQPAAADAFRQSGAIVLSEVDTLASAMADLIGEPTLDHTIVSRVGDRIIVEVPVGPGLNGRAIRELGLPQRVLVLLLQRPGGDLVPSGDTVLQQGDRMLLFGLRDLVVDARERLVGMA